MRFMVLMIPGDRSVETGAMPDAKIVAAMMKYNEQLAKPHRAEPGTDLLEVPLAFLRIQRHGVAGERRLAPGLTDARIGRPASTTA